MREPIMLYVALDGCLAWVICPEHFIPSYKAQLRKFGTPCIAIIRGKPCITLS